MNGEHASDTQQKRISAFRLTLRNLARAFRILHDVWPGFLSGSAVTGVIDALKPLVALFFSARVINELSGGRDVRLILVYASATVLSGFVLTVAGALANQRLNVLKEGNYSNLEYLYVKRYMEMDYPNIEDSRVNQMLADIRARANGNALGLMHLSWMVPSLIRHTVALAASLAMLAGMFTTASEYARNWATSPAATLILAVLAVAGAMTPLLTRRWQKVAIETTQRENPKANTLFMFYMEYKSVKNAAKDIRLYDQAGTVSDIFAKRLNQGMWIRFFRHMAPAVGVSGAANALIGGAVYLFIGLRGLYGMYPLGSVVQYVGAVNNLINNLSGIAEQLGTLLNNNLYMGHIYDYLDLSDPRSDGESKPDAGRIEFEFDNVSFAYPGSDSYALRGLNLRIRPGRRLAVVGMNGSGKTTMVKLLCRLYRPTEGAIRLNGQDIRQYGHADYVRLFNVVFQDFKLLSLPLGENIAASENVDREKAKAALDAAGFGEKLAALEKGLDTMLGKDCDKEGVSLSGGEEQKAAIARAIYRDAPFVVFDEPTAALDPISEYEVYTKLNEIVGGKTAVFISHRLSSCRFCDDIAVFHEGQLVQYGAHDALLADKNGKYAELWNAQAQYYDDRHDLSDRRAGPCSNPSQAL